jgi:hypothetical protein
MSWKQASAYCCLPINDGHTGASESSAALSTGRNRPCHPLPHGNAKAELAAFGEPFDVRVVQQLGNGQLAGNPRGASGVGKGEHMSVHERDARQRTMVGSAVVLALVEHRDLRSCPAFDRIDRSDDATHHRFLWS